VRHQVRGLDPDSRKPERIRDRGDDRHGAVRRHGQDTLDVAAPRNRDHAVDVAEVKNFGGVGLGKAGRVRIPIDRDREEPELASADDCTPLVTAPADEEHSLLHRRRC
jgi:hypothetical protein